MNAASFKFTCVWCAVLLSLALIRVHFRVVTTSVAYNLGRLKEKETSLLEQRASLQADLAKITGRKQLEGLAESGEKGH